MTAHDDKCGEVEIGYYVEIKRGSWAKENGKLAQTFPASGLSYSGSLTKEQMEGIDGLIRDYLEGKTTPSHALPKVCPISFCRFDPEKPNYPGAKAEDCGVTDCPMQTSAPSTTACSDEALLLAAELRGLADMRDGPLNVGGRIKLRRAAELLCMPSATACSADTARVDWMEKYVGRDKVLRVWRSGLGVWLVDRGNGEDFEDYRTERITDGHRTARAAIDAAMQEIAAEGVSNASGPTATADSVINATGPIGTTDGGKQT